MKVVSKDVPGCLKHMHTGIYWDTEPKARPEKKYVAT
jgi:hypothetical protein